MLLLLSTGGKDPEEPKKDPGYSCQTSELEATITLGSNFPQNNPDRATAWGIPVLPNLWTGNQSASTYWDNPNQKYYCKIEITDIECSDYGNNGTKEYVWNSPNNSNSMKIMVPSNHKFKLDVTYCEPCGPY